MTLRRVSCYWLGQRDYPSVWEAMRAWAQDQPEAPDQWWFLEHDPVYTLGQSGKTAGVVSPGAIPVVRSDRGGDVTYHGPGQLIFYPLMTLSGAGIGVRTLVERLEQAVIELLAEYKLTGERRCGAPGVYVEDSKIASLGLRVRRGRCYHGLSLNVSLDLAPFAGIHPCGYEGLAVTRLADLAEPGPTPRRIAPRLAERFGALLGCIPVWSDPPEQLPVVL